MKVDTKPLGIGKSSVEIVGSYGEADQADDLMIALYSVDAAGDDMVKNLQADRNMIKKTRLFFKNILGLSDKQSKEVIDKVPSKIMNLYIPYLCGTIKGAPEQSFAEFKKSTKAETKINPKDESKKVSNS